MLLKKSICSPPRQKQKANRACGAIRAILFLHLFLIIAFFSRMSTSLGEFGLLFLFAVTVTTKKVPNKPLGVLSLKKNKTYTRANFFLLQNLLPKLRLTGRP
jgi:uncharacterized membrane protein